MALYERKQLGTLLERLDETPRTLIFVAGPRQVGKTTLIEQAKEALDRELLLVRVDQPDPRPLQPFTELLGTTSAATPVAVPREPDTTWLVDVWQRARSLADLSEEGCVLALDEIQKIPRWSEAVKGLWDADRY